MYLQKHQLMKIQAIPTTTYDAFTNSPDRELLEDIKTCGTVIIRDVVSEAQVRQGSSPR